MPPTGGTLEGLLLALPGARRPDSFQVWQEHLVRTFGPPTFSSSSSPDWPGEYKWELGDVLIDHHMEFDVGERERVSIRKTTSERS